MKIEFNDFFYTYIRHKLRFSCMPTYWYKKAITASKVNKAIT